MKLKGLFLFLLSLNLGISILCAKDFNSNDIVFRSFDQEKIEVYKENSDFYMLESAPLGLWERIIEWLSNKFKNIFKNVPNDKISSTLGIVIKIFLWGLGIFAVVMIFITLFKHGVFKVIQKVDKSVEIKHQNLEEQILETNWQNLIDIEINAGRFNVALRLLFLQTIQLLNEKKYILWKKNKTNFDYLRELRKTGFDRSFTKLMQYYNFGWFGDFEIKELEFSEIHSEFKTFNTSID